MLLLSLSHFAMSLSLLVSFCFCFHDCYSLAARVVRGAASYFGGLWEIFLSLNPCEVRLDDGFVCLCERERKTKEGG